MTDDQKERDAALENEWLKYPKNFRLGASGRVYGMGFEDGWNASRKHRDLQIEVLKKALEHYADKRNWMDGTGDLVTDELPRYYPPDDPFKQGYEVAEKALKQLREGTK